MRVRQHDSVRCHEKRSCCDLQRNRRKITRQSVATWMMQAATHKWAYGRKNWALLRCWQATFLFGSPRFLRNLATSERCFRCFQHGVELLLERPPSHPSHICRLQVFESFLNHRLIH